MNKLHSLAFYALVTPALTLGSGSVLAQQSTGQDTDRQQRQQQQQQQGTQRDQSESTHRDQRSGAQSASDRQKAGDHSRMQSQAYMNAPPANSTLASDLMGTDLRTSDDEDVGSVDDLIIDDDGKVVAVIVGVGGFLGIGEKDVAISWDSVTQTGTSNDRKLTINASREDLRSAPEFEKRD
ncbi:PRC-barrel domain-containing protein [Marinimicrobium alkaliphilum]|uniref:PRC-barrel domain-containing protein n=1 Tax=Marinimicrobium alkaliphilum TaxID=2202654 RepID=UPI000DBA220E|nr:PRC-barrel domain-containing protein [Marinimicrobium alkaliphilum]